MASAAEATKNLQMLATVCIGPLSCIGHLIAGKAPKKKVLPKRLCALGSDKNDALEWSFKTMSDAT